MNTSLNISNSLTLFRIFILIPFVALFYVDTPWASAAILVLYIVACLSDYFDGYAARRFNQVSKFGTFLDPIADKLLVCTALLMLTGIGVIKSLTLIPTTIILCREIVVLALREFVGQIKVSIPVSNLAKWKTAFQMIALGFLLAHDLWTWAQPLGIYLVWVAAILTIYTGFLYWKICMQYLTENS